MSAHFKIVPTYDHWNTGLAGGVPGYSDGDVYLGYYRYKTKHHANGGDPVAFWLRDDGELVAQVDPDHPPEYIKFDSSGVILDYDNIYGAKSDRKSIAWLFSYCRKYPVSYADYSARLDTGRWPGLNEEVSKQIEAEEQRDAAQPDAPAGIGHNSQQFGEYDELRDNIDALAADINRALKKGAATSKKEADEVSDLADRLSKLWSRADKAREIEKAPFWQKCCEIQEKWRPRLESAAVYKNVKAVCVTPFLSEQKRKRDAEAAVAAAEAKRIRDEADAAARAAESHVDAAVEQGQGELSPEALAAAQDAERLKEQADAAEAEAQRIASRKIAAGTRGRGTHLRSQSDVYIKDRRKAYAHFKESPDLIAAINSTLVKLAESELDQQGKLPPGFGIQVTEKAA